MFRGFLSGIFWGGVAVVCVVGVASLLAPLPATVQPQVQAAANTTASDKEDPGSVGTPSQADEAIGEGNSPAVDTPSDGDALPLADTDPAPKPAPVDAQGGMQAPMGNETTGSVMVDPEAPVSTAAPVMTPAAPDTDAGPVADAQAELSITTNPAQPMAPEVPDVSSAFASPEAADPSDPAVPEGVMTDPDAPTVSEAFVTPKPEVDVTPSAEAGDVSGNTEVAILRPATDLKEKFPQMNSSRLPTIGAEDASMPAVQKPFVANAVPFDAPEGKPLMSIVLIDDGTGTIDKDALGIFPNPLSFAVNTLAPDAAERVATYRDLGFEVLAMVDVPGVASAGDVEVAMQAHLAKIPQAVAVLEGTGEGLQGSKTVSDQVTQVLLQAGYGLVMFPRGLNTAQKLATRDGVPAATVFRDFDGKGQNTNTIRRFLDQAAFKASQEGGVIMVGRLREETISALVLWSVQDRASTVALAPVSAVLRAKQ